MTKDKNRYKILFISLLILPFFLGSCSSFYTSDSESLSELEDTTDPSCSYFYFLWGTHAEYEQRFEEALEAYEKAAICDPEAEYISEKIPILLIKLNRLPEAINWLEAYLLENPEKTIQRFLLARLKIQAGDNQAAITLYQEALAHDPENRNIRLRLGLLYGQEHQFNRARNIFNKLLNENPDSYFACLYMARLMVQTKENDKAIEFYEKAISINWSTELIYEVAELHNSLKNYDKSLELYETILKYDAEEDRASLGVIQSLLYLKRHKEALDKLEIFRNNNSEPHKIDIIIAQILVNNKSYSEAEKLLLPLASDHPSSEVYYLLSVCQYEQGNFAETLKTLKHIEPGTDEFDYAVYLQVKIFRKNKELEKAISLLEQTVNEPTTKSPIFYTYLSTVYRDVNNNTAALETLAQGVKAFPMHERLRYEYALLLDKSGNTAQAIRSMQKVLELNPNHPDALNYIGYYWANSNTNLDKALKYILLAVQLKPQSGYIRDSLGWIYYRLGEFDKAIIELQDALSLEPTDPYIYEHLGDCYQAKNENEKALEIYTKALELFEDTDLKKILQDKIYGLSEKQ